MKKIISVLLSAVMMFTLCMPAFAQEKGAKASYSGDPVVVVKGIHFTGLEREDGSDAIDFSEDNITKLITSYLTAKLKGDSDALADSLITFFQRAFDGIASDKNGNSVYADVHMKKYPLSMDNYKIGGGWSSGEEGLVRAAVDTVGAENTYFFTYDWRKSPLALADELNAFIESIKKQSGKNKVDILPCSMGGMVTTAYLYKYGNSSVDSVTYLSSAHNGTYVAGAALTGDITLDGDVVYSFIKSITKDQNIFIKILLWMVDAVGVFDFLSTYLNGFVSMNKERVYDELLRDYLGTSVGLWGLCCDEDYDDSIEYVFGDCKEEYKGVLAEISKVRPFVMSTHETIGKAIADGVKVSFVSHYNSMLLPIYDESICQGDAVLESDLTSNGGTFALYGKVLSDEHIAKVDSQYISPDKMVDASTCLYKDVTWFIKDAPHVGCKSDSEHAAFAIWLATSEKQPTVYLNSAYPRFMAVDENMNFIG